MGRLTKMKVTEFLQKLAQDEVEIFTDARNDASNEKEIMAFLDQTLEGKCRKLIFGFNREFHSEIIIQQRNGPEKIRKVIKEMIEKSVLKLKNFNPDVDVDEFKTRK